MKQVTSNQRTLNILKKAIELGYEMEENDPLYTVIEDAEYFIIDNTPEKDKREEECEVRQNGRQQQVDWLDGKGLRFQTFGEIVDFSENWHKDPSHKVYHTTVVDSEANVVKLYYLVGETDYNAPDGYYFDRKTNKHVAFD